MVLLAHQAEPFLDTLLADWFATLDSLQRDYEVLLVDDGSTDRTGELAESLKERYGRLLVFRHPTHQGEGAALRTGIVVARFPLLAYARLDPRYHPADLAKLLKEIDKVHIVSGYRAGRRPPLFWRLTGLLWRGLNRIVFGHAPSPLPGWLGWKNHAERFLVRALFGVRNQDVACPYRLIRREALVRIPLQSNGTFAHVEILAKANFLGLYLAEEVPLGEPDRPVPAEPLEKEEIRQLFTEGKRVFKQPDFSLTQPDENKRSASAAPSGEELREENKGQEPSSPPSTPPEVVNEGSANGAGERNG